jgi:hypothetical protein
MQLVRLILAASTLVPLLAAPVLAVPVAEPLATGIGNAGVAINYGYTGKLGNTGLTVTAMPTMLMVTAIAPGSPAAMLDLPSPGTYRVRLAALNGQPVEDLSLRELQALFNPSHERVSITIAKKGPQDLTELLVGPFELPLSNAGIAALQSKWLTAQRRFTEAHDFLSDRDTDTTGLADNLLLAARDTAAGGDYAQALTIVSRIAPGTPLYDEAQRLRSRWQLADMNAQLTKADTLAGQGQFTAALAVLDHMGGDMGWQKIKELRVTQWKGALTHREAYKAYKKTQQARKAQESAEARQAAYAAYRREAIRRYQERQRYQEASREYRRRRGY